MAEKKSFMLYFDNESQFDILTDEQAEKLIKALLRFAKSGEMPDFTDGMLKMAFSFISAQIQRDALKYEERCETNRKIAIEREFKKRERTYTKSTDTDKDTDKDTEKETDTETNCNDSGDQSPEPPVSAIASQNKKKSRTKKALQEVIAEYTQNPELQNALAGFVEMRNKMKKPLTERAMKSCLKKLDQLASTDEMKIAVVDQSVECCWQTFYERKEVIQKKENYRDGVNRNGADIWNVGII
ncbi:MAG: hypothetical protein K2O42_10650 [Oscillospiraceae bacterium]|nr:hypothetical protein [Oscillospiraceae bacterium]